MEKAFLHLKSIVVYGLSGSDPCSRVEALQGRLFKILFLEASRSL